MARTKARQKSQGPRGPGGAKGARGRRGPAGPPAPNGEMIVQLGKVLSRVTQELEDVQRTLKIQFTRIAELQAELDTFRQALKSQSKTLPRPVPAAR